MNGILIRSAIVLGLGVAPGAVFAQSDATPAADSGAAASAHASETIILSQAESGSDGSAGGEAGSDASGSESSGQGESGGQTDNGSGTTGEAGGTDAEGEAESEGQADGETGEAQSDQPAEGAAEDGSAEIESQDAGTRASATSGIEVTEEQTTEMRDILRETKVKTLADIDFDISIGVAVPRTVEFYSLPPRIVEIVPAYAGYRYFVLSDGRIVIVEPDTYEVVYILT